MQWTIVDDLGFTPNSGQGDMPSNCDSPRGDGSSTSVAQRPVRKIAILWVVKVKKDRLPSHFQFRRNPIEKYDILKYCPKSELDI